MLRRISLPYLFVLAAIVTMVLAAGGVWQFARPMEEMLRALVPTWVGIACVFWVLWRQVPAADDRTVETRPAPRHPARDFEPLRLDTRYGDIARLPLGAMDYVVVDTETAGGDADGDAIVQIGAVRISGGEIVEEEPFTRRVNPDRPIAPASTRLHGLTDEAVADAPPVETALADFIDYAGDAVLVGHNIAVDLSLRNGSARIDNPVLDTMLLSLGVFEARRDHTLDALAEHFHE
ncbi:unnamed protein product, partial [Discosporangium mesarthrocarpum]